MIKQLDALFKLIILFHVGLVFFGGTIYLIYMFWAEIVPKLLGGLL